LTIVDSDNAEAIKFYWKVSCESGMDYLEFYIDDVRQSHRITGETDWALQSYSLSAGIHTLKWRYTDGGGDSGDNCGWVDFVQWTGPSPKQDPTNWQQIVYKQDVTGRRVEKKVDGYSTRYVYDGSQVIAEYDGNNNLLRKYIYGPGIDQPVCMIDVADSKTYYYHYDALGSVVALSDSSGSTVETYEYSVYGEVAASDANNPNPYMFAGRRYDIEIGLYYNRARYYNPYTGRFLQTDPVGYDAGINMYRYCQNNPLTFTDADGLTQQVVTGRYWVLPNDITPDEAMNLLSATEAAGLIVDLTEDEVKVPGAEYWEYAEEMAKEIGEAKGVEWWRTYIEVFDWNDVNKDGVIDENEKSDPYWIEVSGIKMKHETENVWTEGGGYTTWGHAADAGGSAVAWALKNGGKIPNKIDPAYLDAGWGNANPYGTKHYQANQKVLNATKRVHDWVSFWKRVYGVIDKM
jgi:RHS repeat-associated protein